MSPQNNPKGFRDSQDGGSSVVFTSKAHCRDCYRCLRVCPVKAIRMEKGQAYVVRERCISCGTCIRECPQGAKSYRADMDRAARLIAAGPRAGHQRGPLLRCSLHEVGTTTPSLRSAQTRLRPRRRNRHRSISGG